MRVFEDVLYVNPLPDNAEESKAALKSESKLYLSFSQTPVLESYLRISPSETPSTRAGTGAVYTGVKEGVLTVIVLTIV